LSENPAASDELSALADGELRRIAYGRGHADAAGGVTREAAAEELARRTPPPVAPPPAAPHSSSSAGSAGSPIGPGSSIDDELADDELPPPFWTRARLVGAAVLVASIAVGAAVGVGVDRVADALAPESLTVFDRPPSEIEIAALDGADQFGLGFGSAAAGIELRHLATVDEVDVFAQLVPADYGTPRSDVGDQVCLLAMAPDASFVSPPCVPRAVFERQGIGGQLSEMDTSGTYPLADNLRSLSIVWGPRGGAEVALSVAERSAP